MTKIVLLFINCVLQAYREEFLKINFFIDDITFRVNTLTKQKKYN